MKGQAPARTRRGSFRPLPAPAALVCALALWAGTAQAAPHDVVLIGGGPSFQNAVTVALNAWNLHVVASDATAPGADATRAPKEARAIVDRYAASGVVWVASHDGQHALFVYDAETDQLVARTLGRAPPFDAPTAAAAALSVKTLLRASTVAPPEERLGAGTSGRSETSPGAPGSGASGTSPRGESGSGSASGDAVSGAGLGAGSSAAPITVEVTGALRAVASDADTRLTLGAAFWFGGARRFGIALRGEAGPGLQVDAPRFRGRFSELGLGPSLRYRIPLLAWLRVEPRAGMSLHSTSIDGVAVQTAQSAERHRVDASVDVGGVLDVLLSPTAAIGLDLGGAAMLRYQRYLVGPTPVLTLAPLQGSAGLRLAVGLP